MNTDELGKRKEKTGKKKGKENGERSKKYCITGEAVSSAQLSLSGDNGCGGVTGMNVFISD